MEESGNQSGINPHVGEGDLAVQTLKYIFNIIHNGV
jgi:hypothetical protein